jgi:long-chain acyl-CoA synthetase
MDQTLVGSPVDDVILTEMSDAASKRTNGAARWTKSYAPGVPATIDLAGVSSFSEVLTENLKKYSDRQALRCLGATWTYRRLDTESKRFAAFIQTLGLGKGSRIALMMPTIPQYLVAFIGILRSGCVVVNVNPLYTPRELEHQLVDSGAEAIVILDQFAATFEKVRAKTVVQHVIVTSAGDMFGGLKGMVANFVQRRIRKVVPKWRLPGHRRYRDVLAKGAKLPFKDVPLTQDDIAILQYTGGTTGVAKGAVLLHRNLIAATMMANAWLQPALDEHPKIEAPVFLIPLPLYHVLTMYVTAVGLLTGGVCELVPNPRDTSGLIKTMRDTRFHLMIGLNTLYAALLAHEGIGGVDFSQARAFIAGGMATRRAVAERWQKRTGRWIIEGWGMTETVGAGTCNPYPPRGFNGTIGLPLPSVSISIRDEQGREAAIGEPGEICVAGPQVMAGYWRRPEETAKAVDANGYLATGDIGVMDEAGFIRIVDRKSDMILVSGFNVYPNEIEDVAASAPGVLEAAAVGVHDDKTGEAVKLFVVRTDPSVTADDVRRHCEARLTNYKRPRQIEFVADLPKTPVGKVLRRQLRNV